RAAVEVGGLISRDVVGTFARLPLDLVGTHGLDDFSVFICHERRCFKFIVVEIDGHAHEGTAEAIAIGRVKIQIDVAIAIEAAVYAAALYIAEIVVAHRPFPLSAPFWRPVWDWRCSYWPAVGLHLSEVTTTNEPVWPVIEIIAVELVDAHANRTGRDER